MNFVLSILFSIFAVTVVILIPWIGVGALDLRVLFGIVIPYAAMATFFVGIVVRVIGWSRSPVPFRIPTTAGVTVPEYQTRVQENRRGSQDRLRMGKVALDSRPPLPLLVFCDFPEALQVFHRACPRICYPASKP